MSRFDKFTDFKEVQPTNKLAILFTVVFNLDKSISIIFDKYRKALSKFPLKFFQIILIILLVSSLPLINIDS